VSFEVQPVVRVGERTNRVTSSLTQALPWIGGVTLRTADSKDEQASSEITKPAVEAGGQQKGPIVVASRRVAC
jgi:hypothetical protein